MNNISINIPMLRRRFWRIFGYKCYKEMCDKEWIISPSTISITPPATFLPGETNKVTGLEQHTNFNHEQRRVNGGLQQHSATLGRTIRNVVFFGGYIYKKSSKIQLSVEKEYFFSKNHGDEHINHASLACSLFENKYFGHWMTDGIPLLMAGRELAPPVRNSAAMTAHQVQYLSMLEMEYNSFTGGKINELIVIEDFSQNKYKRDRYEKIRSTFNKTNTQFTHSGVIILRNMSKDSRVLINENQVANYLISIGFKVIDPQKKSAGEIVQEILGARVVIGVEGSHLSHGLFSMSPKGTLLVLQPPYRFNNVYKDYTDCLDLKYGFIVGEACEGGFTISIDRLKKILDLINIS